MPTTRHPSPFASGVSGYVWILCFFVVFLFYYKYISVFLSISVSYQFLLFTSVSFVLFLHLVLNIICHSKKSFSISSFKPIFLSFFLFLSLQPSTTKMSRSFSLGFNCFSKVCFYLFLTHRKNMNLFVFALIFRVQSIATHFVPRSPRFFVLLV